jgi:hypothetical protein
MIIHCNDPAQHYAENKQGDENLVPEKTASVKRN